MSRYSWTTGLLTGPGHGPIARDLSIGLILDNEPAAPYGVEVVRC